MDSSWCWNKHAVFVADGLTSFFCVIILLCSPVSWWITVWPLTRLETGRDVTTWPASSSRSVLTRAPLRRTTPRGSTARQREVSRERMETTAKGLKVTRRERDPVPGSRWSRRQQIHQRRILFKNEITLPHKRSTPRQRKLLLQMNAQRSAELWSSEKSLF